MSTPCHRRKVSIVTTLVTGFCICFVAIFLWQSITPNVSEAFLNSEPSATVTASDVDKATHIREIEANIYFTNSSAQRFDVLYSTGLSPHYYDGIFSVEKTCKRSSFSYMCRPGTIHEIKDYPFTFKIDMEALSEPTKLYLQRQLQTQGFYTNTYDSMLSNIRTRSSPFIRNINILFIGNSHIRQLVESIMCLMDSISTTDIVSVYDTAIEFIDKNKSSNVSYATLPCHGIRYDRSVSWNTAYKTALFLNKSIIEQVRQEQIRQNIAICNHHYLYTQLTDGTKLNFIFMHNEEDKSLVGFVASSLVEPMRAHDLDVIVLNVGNDPHYNFTSRLVMELKQLKLDQKPIVFLDHWNQRTVSASDRAPFETSLPNMVYVDWRERLKYFDWGSVRALGTHFCQPGVGDHAALAVLNLINSLLAMPE